MEIINPSSVKKAISDGRHQVFVSFIGCGSGLHFSKGAMEDFLLTEGMRLVFAIDLGRLYFYITDKKDEGFKIYDNSRHGGHLFGRVLINTIHSRLPSTKKKGMRFPVRASNTRINDCATFEILIDKKL